MNGPRNSAYSGSIPSADAFYLPADTCHQARLWVPWPPQDPDMQAAVAATVRAAAAFEPVALVAAPDAVAGARRTCDCEIDDILPVAPQSLRLRDTGPTFLVDGKGGSAAVNWRFNGWGKRGSEADTGLAHALLGAAEVRRFRAPLTLEGSSIVSDGRGTLLASSAAAFDPARNATLPPLEAFGIFQDWLGIARVIWLTEVHPHDALLTDVRALAAFVAPGLAAVTDADDAVSQNVIAQMKRSRDARGKNIDVLRLPRPPAGNCVASYTNFLPVNGGVLVPAFDAPTDTRAADILAEVFPERVIQLVPARVLASAGITLTSLALPHPARLLERDRATVLPRSSWSQPTPDAESMLQHYIDLAERET